MFWCGLKRHHMCVEIEVSGLIVWRFKIILVCAWRNEISISWFELCVLISDWKFNYDCNKINVNHVNTEVIAFSTISNCSETVEAFEFNRMLTKSRRNDINPRLFDWNLLTIVESRHVVWKEMLLSAWFWLYAKIFMELMSCGEFQNKG